MSLSKMFNISHITLVYDDSINMEAHIADKCKNRLGLCVMAKLDLLYIQESSHGCRPV